MFVTMACLDVRAGRVTCANAGHDATLLVRGRGGSESVFGASGTVLGLFPGREYATETLVLEDGDSLVLYTDGVTDAANAAGDLFGEERLRACFAGGAGRSAAGTVDLLLRAVREFAGDAPQSDDITILALRRDAAGAPAPGAARP
jgi:sigma-B regulation protein RsbU (phosphoserine phosphatase)